MISFRGKPTWVSRNIIYIIDSKDTFIKRGHVSFFSQEGSPLYMGTAGLPPRTVQSYHQSYEGRPVTPGCGVHAPGSC